MSNPCRDSMNIHNLPDEILCAILNKLSMIDVFYSLVDVNERFDRLILDSLYTRHLNFVANPSIEHYSSSTNDQVLDQVCEKILPRICNNVYKLTVEPFSLQRVLGIADYPQLHSLSLVNFPVKTLLSQLTGDTVLARLLNDQITELRINSYVKPKKTSDTLKSTAFGMILCVSKQLCDLTFSPYILKDLSNFDHPTTSCTSSTLTKLNVSVYSFDDCLYLLDGRFECLSTLIVEITVVPHSLSKRENHKKLPQMRHLSLSMERFALFYDEKIVPLLRRMSDLEELTLFLSIARCDSTFMDGKQLYNDVLSSMTRLKKLSFSIHTLMINEGVKMKLPSNNDIRNSFFELGYKQMDVFGDIDFVNHLAESHIYSLPYQFKTFDRMISAFQGGKFDQVRILIMFDRRPFEHRLFQIIARDFPFLHQLLVVNLEEQQVKDRSGELITFSHLCQLGIGDSHTDYVSEFLSNENIVLPRLTTLSIAYQTLVTVTNSFTSNQARLICNKITLLRISEPFVRPENFDLYFPRL